MRVNVTSPRQIPMYILMFLANKLPRILVSSLEQNDSYLLEEVRVRFTNMSETAPNKLSLIGFQRLKKKCAELPSC